MLTIKTTAVVAACLACLAYPGFAGASGLGIAQFDDVSVDNFSVVPNGHVSLNWDSFFVINRNHVPGSGYDNGTVSGDYTAFNVQGGTAEILALGETSFNAENAFFTAAWRDGLNLTIDAFLNNVAVDSISVVLNTEGPQLINLDFMNIDRLVFTSSGGTSAGLGTDGTHFAMDNFTFSVNAVPGPAALWLAPLVSAAFGRRRRRG